MDVHYRAFCTGNNVGMTGVIRAFVGMSNGCFGGDAEEISSKPACPVGQVNGWVESVVHCNE
jgi:hypothetical protein